MFQSPRGPVIVFSASNWSNQSIQEGTRIPLIDGTPIIVHSSRNGFDVAIKSNTRHFVFYIITTMRLEL